MLKTEAGEISGTMNSARVMYDYSDLNELLLLYIIVFFASSIRKKKPFKSESLWNILHIACFIGLF